jgi:hypothetical protein
MTFRKNFKATVIYRDNVRAMKLGNKSVAILDTGITSIMVALKLVDADENKNPRGRDHGESADYKISVYTKSPDPRLDRDAEQHSATGNGRSARFVSGLEGKPHLFDGSVLSDALDQLHTPLPSGGWFPCISFIVVKILSYPGIKYGYEVDHTIK